MGTCIEKLPHSCGTDRGLQVFLEEDGRYTGHCFSCGEHVPDPYKERPDYKPEVKIKTEEDIKQELAEIRKLKAIELPERMLKKESLAHFGIRIGFSERDGKTPMLAAFPYRVDGKVTGAKMATLSKPRKVWSVGRMKGVDLFGWKEAVATGDKRLYITEGEFDAVALWQVICESNKGDFAGNIPAVVSIPHGAASAARDIGRLLPKIRQHFKEVVLVFDMDEPGRKAAEEVCKILPEAMSAELPAKDANECLMEGYKKALFNAVRFKAAKPKNSRIVDAESLHEAAKEPAAYGVSWPWDYITEKTRGIRKGETIYIGAAQKMGKSEVVNAIGSHLIKEHGWTVLMAKPEEANKKTYKLMCGKIVGKVFHDPNIPFDYDAYDRAGELLRGKLKLINIYQHLGWETLKADIVFAATNGVDAVFIDPITNLTNGMNAADANTKLQEVAQELSAMAKDLNIVIFIFCHLRNKEGGKPHDRGGEVLTSEFAGSRAMGRSCNYMFGIEGNKDPELSEEQRNVRTLVLLDDREFGEVGRCQLQWQKHTGMFKEI